MVVHRIGLMMFKYSLELFTRDYEFHNHYTRQSQSLHTAVGRNEAIYKTFSVDVSYASFKRSSTLLIQNNSIPDRIS